MRCLVRCTLLCGFMVATSIAASSQVIEADQYVALKTEYDRFKDEMTVQTQAMKVFEASKFESISLMFGYQHKGSTPPAKLPLAFFVNCVIKKEAPPTVNEVDVIAGSKRFSIGNFGTPISKNLVASVYLHQYAAVLTFDQAMAIALATKPEMRISGVEVSLSKEQVNALRRLLKRIDSTLPLKEE